jgi:hypothetical protein
MSVNRQIVASILKSYLEKFFNIHRITIKDKNTQKTGTGRTIRYEYYKKLEEIITQKTKFYMTKRGEPRLDLLNLDAFFSGKISGYKLMRLFENGASRSNNLFFFGTGAQQLFKNVVEKRMQRYISQKKIKRLSTKTQKAKGFRKFQILKGDSGDGILARYDHFSPRAKGILKMIYIKRGIPFFKGKRALNIYSDLLDFFNVKKNELLYRDLKNLIKAEKVDVADINLRSIILSWRMRKKIETELQARISRILK